MKRVVSNSIRKIAVPLCVGILSLYSFESKCQSLILDSLYATNGLGRSQVYGTPRFLNVFALTNGKTLNCGYIHRYSGPPPPPAQALDYYVTRYNECGEIDSSYGDNGRLTINNFSASNFLTKKFILLPDESLLICGSIFGNETALFKITPDGTNDSTFTIYENDSYFDDISFPSNRARFLTAELLIDNKILCIGSYKDSSGNGILFSKFNQDGSFDDTYFSSGILKAPLDIDGVKILDIFRSASDKLIFVGQNDDSYLISFATNNEGILDESYGVNGMAIDSSTTFDNYGFFENSTASIINNNKLYIGYKNDLDFNNGFAINRYLDNGQIDSSFGLNGKVILPVPNSNLFFVGINNFTSSKVLVGISAIYNSAYRKTFVINDDGQIDSTLFSNVILEINGNEYPIAFEVVKEIGVNRWLLAGNAYEFSINSRFTNSSSVPHIELVNNELHSGVDAENVTFQWFRDGLLIEGATNSFLPIASQGEYAVLVTDNLFCGSYSDTLIVNILNVNSKHFESFKIFPNPAKKHINIEGEFENVSYKIINSQGKIKQTGTLETKNPIDITMLESGIYVLIIRNEISKRFVIQK